MTLTEKKALEVLPSLDHSLAHVRKCALTGLEREGEPTRKSGRRDLLKWPSFVCFLAALQDGGLLEINCFSSMVSSMVPLANAS